MGSSASTTSDDGGSTDTLGSERASLWDEDLTASVALPPAVLGLFDRELCRLTGDVERDFLVLDEITSIRFEGRDHGLAEARRWSRTGETSTITSQSTVAVTAASSGEGGEGSSSTTPAESVLAPPAQPSPSPPSLLSGLPLDFHLDMQHLVRSMLLLTAPKTKFAHLSASSNRLERRQRFLRLTGIVM